MTTTVNWRDPTNPQDRQCAAAPVPGLCHRLIITGPLWHRIMRCVFCRKSERTLRTEIEAAS